MDEKSQIAVVSVTFKSDSGSERDLHVDRGVAGNNLVSTKMNSLVER